MRRWQLAVGIAVVMAGAWIWLLRAVDAQRPKGSDTDQIRAVIARGARAAQRRDAATLRKLISDDWNGLGLRAPQVRQQIGSVLARAQEVRVYIPDNTLRVTVDPDHRGAHAAFSLEFQALGGQVDLPAYRGILVLRLAREPVRYYWIFPGHEWRVVGQEGFVPDSLPF